MSNKKIETRLRRLIDAAIGGQLSDEDFRQLDETLKTDDEALATYLDYCQLEADLFFHARATLAERRVLSDIDLIASSCEQPEPASAKSLNLAAWRTRYPNLSTRWLPAIAAALLVAIGIGFGVVGNRWFAGEKVGSSSIAEADAIHQNGGGFKAVASYEARLMQGTPCVWAPDMRSRLDSLSTLHSGDSLNLIAGLAELQLSWPMRGNVTLRLEGPAGLVLMADGGASLNYGKLTADVSLQYESFVIETPVGRVLVNDKSNVGVAASSGDVEIHVFSGTAEVAAPWTSSVQETSALRIRAGRSIRIKPSDSGNVEIVRGRASPGRFASEVSMSADSLEISDGYVDAVKKSSPIAYWRMDAPVNDVVKNVMSDHNDAHVSGKPIWVEERGNMSVEFGTGLEADKLRALLITNEPFKNLNTDAYSIELWAKPSHYHWGTMVSLATPPSKKVAAGMHAVLFALGGRSLIYSGIEHPGRIRFLHRSPPSADTNSGTSCFSDQPYGLRKWQHLVAVKDKSQMRLYVDSKLMASAKDNSRLSGDFELVVGQIDRDRDVRPFVGQIDELAFYKRALTEQEIEQHYRIVRPKPAPPKRAI